MKVTVKLVFFLFQNLNERNNLDMNRKSWEDEMLLGATRSSLPHCQPLHIQLRDLLDAEGSHFS